MREIRIYFNDFSEQVDFLRKHENELRSSPGFHFFFEPGHEIRLRSNDLLVYRIGLECVLNCIPFRFVIYEQEEYDLYGNNAWSKVKEYFTRNSLTSLDYFCNNFEKPKKFYAKRYAHLLLNNLGYTYTDETKFYLKMFLRYLVVSFFFSFMGEERTGQILCKLDRLIGW